MERRLAISILLALLVAACAADQGTPRPTTSGPAPTGSPTATPTARPTPLPTPSPSAVPSSASWRRATPGSVGVIVFGDLTWTGDRFVAVATDSEGRQLFLVSSDGVTWEGQAGAGPADETTRLAAGPAGLVAVGTIGGRNSSWTSPDGTHWSEHRNVFRTASGARSRGSVADVVARGNGWLAVGTHDPSCSGLCAPDRALLWTSSDGTIWTELPNSKPLRRGFMDSVGSAGDGFVAAGPSLEQGVAIWTSPDGSTWSYVSSGPAFVGPAGADYGVGGTGVASRDGRTIVVGYAALEDDSYVPVAWRSDDGGPWSKVDLHGTTAGQLNIISTADGFLAGGWSDDCTGGIWSSNDGSAWECDATVREMADFSPVAIASSGSVDVAVGAADVEDGAIWYRTR